MVTSLTQKDKDNFQVWMMQMDQTLEEFFTMFSKENQKKLDYSAESLNVLEDWILKNYSSVEQIKKEAKILERLAVYIGEVYRKNLGGVWKLEDRQVKDKKGQVAGIYAFYGLPVIVQNSGDTISPYSLAIATVDRKKGNYLSQVLKHS